MVASALAGLVLVLGGSMTLGARAQAGSNTTAVPTAAQKYKNIQVLKDIPADELIPAMQFITASLGVECDFCHVEDQSHRLVFDKDDKKEKKTARQMMQMMFAINKSNFQGEREVTCNTCHRGSPHPQAIPAILAFSPKPEAMATMHDHEHDMNPADLPSGEPVLAKYIQAIGGQPALEKIATRVEKGKALMPEGEPVPIDIYTKAPDERVSVMHMAKGDSVTAYNGQAGWIAFAGRPTREMSAADEIAARLDAEAFYPLALERQFAELKLQPHPEKVGGSQANVVLGLTNGQAPVKLYFDATSGFLVRMVHYTDTPLGLNPTQVDFADYRDADGVKTPYRWTIARPSGAFTIEVDQVESNVAIDDAKFVKPSPAPTERPASGATPQGPKPPQGSTPPSGTSAPPSGAL